MSFHRNLSRARLLFILSLFVSLALCLAFSWGTRDVMAHPPLLGGQGEARSLAASQSTLVDLHPWHTAQALAELAVTVEEAEYAHEAERLADHEVDQTFASALRQVGTQPHLLTGEALTLSQKLVQFQQIVKEDQARLHPLAGCQSLLLFRNQPSRARYWRRRSRYCQSAAWPRLG